jgi:hypothetical protein
MQKWDKSLLQLENAIEEDFNEDIKYDDEINY